LPDGRFVTDGDSSAVVAICDIRLIETWGRRCGLVVAFRGPMGWLPNRLPAACGLA
jgi:hypothetical protein